MKKEMRTKSMGEMRNRLFVYSCQMIVKVWLSCNRVKFWIMVHSKEIHLIVEKWDDIWELCNPLIAYVFHAICSID